MKWAHLPFLFSFLGVALLSENETSEATPSFALSVCESRLLRLLRPAACRGLWGRSGGRGRLRAAFSVQVGKQARDVRDGARQGQGPAQGSRP